ncbi:transcriptional regulator [Candidatus Woesearchaeota archaeon CG_4_10_14_0_2_um_filter_57_5]|nr:MAG: transcriptional regulator [Candidatus Woesearchaeota archaeon CG_4_10_14_0_2_um_filter_57_5]
MLSRRQHIAERLQQGALSAQQLSYELTLDLREVLDDLRHIARSVKSEGKTLLMHPACCKKCGYVFKERSRVKSPTKCPCCRSEWIQQPLFAMVGMQCR